MNREGDDRLCATIGRGQGMWGSTAWHVHRRHVVSVRRPAGQHSRHVWASKGEQVCRKTVETRSSILPVFCIVYLIVVWPQFKIDNDNNNIEVRWKGSIKLFRMEMNKLVLNTDLGSIDLLDDDYYEALLPFFKKAYNVATKMPMFEEAILEKSGICHHDRTCDFMTLTIDADNVKLFVSCIPSIPIYCFISSRNRTVIAIFLITI